MALKRPSRGKLTQLVSHHILCNVNRNELLAIVHRDGVPDHFREDRRPSRPRPDNLLFEAAVQQLDLLHQVIVYKRPLFQRTAQDFLLTTRGAASYFFSRLLTMKRSVCLLFRVLYPRVGFPHGVTGWRPPEVRPSPPPRGWSTGFM